MNSSSKTIRAELKARQTLSCVRSFTWQRASASRCQDSSRGRVRVAEQVSVDHRLAARQLGPACAPQAPPAATHTHIHTNPRQSHCIQTAKSRKSYQRRHRHQHQVAVVFAVQQDNCWKSPVLVVQLPAMAAVDQAAAPQSAPTYPSKVTLLHALRLRTCRPRYALTPRQPAVAHQRL